MTEQILTDLINIFLVNSSQILSFGIGGLSGIAFVITANKRWF